MQAQVLLGRMYRTGDGIGKDTKQAVKWLGRAAARGNAEACFNLGSMYLRGEGVPQDEERAMLVSARFRKLLIRSI